MHENDWIAEQFEAHRSHLRAVAYRMLASASDADDAVQEVWLRLDRSNARDVENLRGWLTTIVARVALDMLRSRKARREEPLDEHLPEQFVSHEKEGDPAREMELADSVGLALLVTLDRLSPAERIAFVLHDMFALPFNEIAPIVGCSPTAARQLASRARRRVQGTTALPTADLAHKREIAAAFLAAARGGNFNALLALLDPDVVLRADSIASPPHGRELRGATNVAKGATAFPQRAQFAQLVLVNNTVALVVAPQGRLSMALMFTIAHTTITAIEIIADPTRLHQLELVMLGD